MKKAFVLFALIIGLSSFLSGQTFIWEAFDAGQMPPAGWTISGLPQQWSINNGNVAGGTPPEAKFTYTNGTTTTRLISMMIVLTGFTEVHLSFRHMYDDYTGAGPAAGVATRAHNGTWHSVWEINPNTNVGPEQIDLVINNSDVGQSEFQICFYLNGNMYNIDYWFLDNILLFHPLNLDGGLISLAGTPQYFGGPVPVKGTVMNVGLTQINSLEIQWQLDNGIVYTSNFTGLSLDLQETFDFTCAQMMDAAIGAHILSVWINLVNGVIDNFQGNDTLMKNVYRVSNVTERRPAFEEFTSSTCPPCATFNAQFVPWCLSHDSDITLIKYQMNWPAPGDPYYTEEGGVRRDYYGVGFVPDLYCNGEQVSTDIPSVQNAFDNAILQPGLLKIAASHTFTGHVINVHAAILPFADLINFRVHIIVMERITTGNVGTNGETEFHHVMMKMIPDAYGTTVNFTDRQTYTIDQSVDLTGTHVEEWDDLIVAVLVQDYASKEIYQSAYSIEDGIFNTEARLTDILMDGSSLSGFDPDVFYYEVHLPNGTTIVPVIEGIPIDPAATVIVVPAQAVPGSTMIDVFAEDLTAHNVYEVEFFEGGVGIIENPVPVTSVYPNPSRGMIMILGAYHSRISVFAATGTLLTSIKDFTGTSLDLSGLPRGVYTLKIERSDGRVLQKKIVIL